MRPRVKIIVVYIRRRELYWVTKLQDTKGFPVFASKILFVDVLFLVWIFLAKVAT